MGNKIASLFDLKIEQWIRLRESGDIVWKTRDGRTIPINEMTDSHLANTIAMMDRVEQENDMYNDLIGIDLDLD